MEKSKIEKSKLVHFRRQLMEMREDLTMAIDQMLETVSTGQTAPGDHDAAVSDELSKELALEQHEETIRQQVIQALERIEQGQFGICQDCRGPISLERLEAIPYAALCVQCERRAEAG
jgi:RNA polymerase-binding protein DksA